MTHETVDIYMREKVRISPQEYKRKRSDVIKKEIGECVIKIINLVLEENR